MGTISCTFLIKDEVHYSTAGIWKRARMKRSMMLVISILCGLLLLSSDATSSATTKTVEEVVCEEEGRECRDNGGTVDECTPSVDACKLAVGAGGPPPDVLGDELYNEFHQDDYVE